jgi:hypothetical protein
MATNNAVKWLQSSRKLHSDMIARAVFFPIAFFNTVPIVRAAIAMCRLEP